MSTYLFRQANRVTDAVKRNNYNKNNKINYNKILKYTADVRKDKRDNYATI